MRFRNRMALRASVLGFGTWLAIAALALAQNGLQDGLRHTSPPAVQTEEGPFLAENDAAMTKMMNDMTIKPTGDIDRDFTAMMVPHHQGAIDMAKAELRYGKNVQLQRIAQEIIVEQLQEIAAMRLAIGEPLPPSIPAPTQPDQTPTPSGHGGAMMMSHDHTNMSPESKK
jgi:hypothetical protein